MLAAKNISHFPMCALIFNMQVQTICYLYIYVIAGILSTYGTRLILKRSTFASSAMISDSTNNGKNMYTPVRQQLAYGLSSIPCLYKLDNNFSLTKDNKN